MRITTDVLNPILYRKLQRHFGTVKVTNRGQAMIAGCVRAAPGGRPRLSISHHGEQYAVSCPFCGDTRSRLFLSHKYGQRDPSGRVMKFLAICFNETACMSKPENRTDLWDTLNGTQGLTTCTVREGRQVPEGDRAVAPPGPMLRLDALDARHPARLYLQSRGFDPDKLGRAYGVSYCTQSHYSLACDRLIIPITQGGKLKGWQSRHVGELNWHGGDKTRHLPPKYFTMPGMRKGLLLYNLDKARQYETGVIVEGAADVWSFGPMAVATFGCCMSDEQRRTFLSVFRRKTAVLLYDPEAMGEPQVVALIGTLRLAMPGAFAAVKLPEGKDPGALDRDGMRQYVAEQARDQGVKVRYRKRS